MRWLIFLAIASLILAVVWLGRDDTHKVNIDDL